MLETLSIIGNILTIPCVIFLAMRLHKLGNENYDLHYLVASKDAGLLVASNWFKAYAVQHRAKGSAEANAKADVNESRSLTLRRLAEKDITND